MTKHRQETMFPRQCFLVCPGLHRTVSFLRFLLFVEYCSYSVKYFNFCWCEVVATSKQRLSLLSAILIPSWWLVRGAKVTTRVLVSVCIVSDVKIMTSTKCCSMRRMTVDCIAIFTVNDATFEWLHVVRVS